MEHYSRTADCLHPEICVNAVHVTMTITYYCTKPVYRSRLQEEPAVCLSDSVFAPAVAKKWQDGGLCSKTGFVPQAAPAV